MKLVAVITFLSGVAALLGWLLLTGADATSLHLLRRSLWYFVLVPILIGIPLGLIFLIGDLANFPVSPFLSLAFFVVFGEAFKLWAARSETSGIRIFALVSLFGILELMLARPLMLNLPAGDVKFLWYLALAIPAVFLHVLTAAIYAFHWRERPEIQLIVCIAIHLGFNLAAEWSDWISDGWFLATLVPLIGATWLLIPGRDSEKRGTWSLPRQDKSAPA